MSTTHTEPLGGCQGNCIAGTLGDEARANHDALVANVNRFLADGDTSALCSALQSIAEAGRTRRGKGLPMPDEFVEFVAQHNWPSTAVAFELAQTVEQLTRGAIDGYRVVTQNRGQM